MLTPKILHCCHQAYCSLSLWWSAASCNGDSTLRWSDLPTTEMLPRAKYALGPAPAHFAVATLREQPSIGDRPERSVSRILACHFNSSISPSHFSTPAGTPTPGPLRTQ